MASLILPTNGDDVHSIRTDNSINLSIRNNKDDDHSAIEVTSSGTNDFESFVLDETDLDLEDDDRCCHLTCCTKNKAYHFGGGEGHGVHVNEAFSGETVYVETVMEFNNYRKWYDILITDDARKFDKIINKAGDVKKKLMINGRFKFNIPHAITAKATRKAHQQFERPLCVAAACASSGVFEKLLKEDVCVTARDKHGCNVVHALVMAAAECPELEDQYFLMYDTLLENTDRDTQRALLLGETLQGQRPLELAAKMGAFGIFRVILETPSFYGKILCQTGACSFYRYNLSDYEDSNNSKRYFRSPLRYICNLQEEHVQGYLDHNIHEMPVMKSWMKRKYQANSGLILLWLVIKFINVVFCTIIDPVALPMYVRCNQNNTAYPECSSVVQTNWLVTSTVFAAIIGVYSVIVVHLDVLDLVICRPCKREKRLSEYGMGNNHFGTLNFYRGCHFLLALSTIIMLLVTYFYKGNEGEVTVRAGLICKAIMLPFIVIDLFHVLENTVFFGTFVTTMQRLILTTLKYILFSILVQIIFASYFYATITGFVPSAHEGVVPTNTGFGTVMASIYTTFLMMLNASTPVDDVVFRFPFYLYIILMILLLLNYLIAVLLDIQKLTPEKLSLLRDIRNLLLAITIEERFGTCLRRMDCSEKNTGYFIVSTYIKDRNFRKEKSTR